MQNQQKIQNQQTPVPESPRMSDRDLVNDLLSMEKYLTASYNNAMNEASHEALYQDLLSVFTETQNEQRELFNLMFQNGWYKLEAAEQQKVQQSLQQHQGYSNQFPYGNQMQ
ncbi:spore coat protein [Heyndrickxia sporothermodurans]|uniref:spore coat protein n=1 Tax=Heyndrickxia sporothermodurans TaxID=46224 RepID=UPI002DB56429|nr:spore coat protein [Heyndrickxia sporothermodurans]MEB6548767.1 spore coat protein [Heyndrickxia sporothermodurans]MED3652049.1 spore coat protein [Heyndrickxia sporothermodurans]MED3697564.1 spore coat protein [Heyndrickxia sporothermodurans]